MHYSKQIASNRILTLVGETAGTVRTYVVGGFVRDLMMGKNSKDIDVVCVGSGIELAKKIARKLGGNASLNVFKNFGTAQIKYGDQEVEIVGARKESYRNDSRKPIVEDGTLEDDQKRRDFTINALAICLNKDRFGELLDPFDGVNDLKRKLLKTPLDPSVTFSDDPLRIMRAFRFAARLNFDIEANTFEAIRLNEKRLQIVSQERITEELNKTILTSNPEYGFNLMYHAGILETVFPEMAKLHGVKTIEGKGHKDNFFHTLKVLQNVVKKSDNLWLRWAAILHDIAKPRTQRFDKDIGWTFHGHEEIGARMVPKIFKKLRLPLNENMKYVQKLVRLHLRPIALVSDEITDSALRRLLFEAGDDLDDLMILCRADITSKNNLRVAKYLKNFDKVEKKLKEIEERDHIRNFQPPVTGETIMEYFGISPSKMVGEIKDEIKEAILEGKIGNNFEQAFDLMKEIGSIKGLKRNK
ncbi:MAG: CCA tRNA nucleotidyltransferase [Cytophagales bacterium]|nr:CCA tRNA nucleotidyltransferase [Cytophagales bacterium]